MKDRKMLARQGQDVNEVSKSFIRCAFFLSGDSFVCLAMNELCFFALFSIVVRRYRLASDCLLCSWKLA